MTLQPCPNEECRGDQIAVDEFRDTEGGVTGFAFCLRCWCSGPRTPKMKDAIGQGWAEAARLWNALPRTEPWVSVAERMPEDGTRVDLVFAKNPDCEVDEDYTVTTDPELMHERGFVPLDSVAPCYTHWRPHTPPRGPVSR